MAFWEDIANLVPSWDNVASIAPAVIGLAGQGLSIADNVRQRDQQTDQLAQQKARYDQAQAQYGQQMQVFQQILAQYQQVQAQRQQQFALQQKQQEEERARQQAYYTQQQAYAAKVQDPAQAVAGAREFYRPLSDEARQNISRDAQAEMAMRGVTDGQAANLLSAKAFAPYEAQAQDRAMAEWFQSQQQGQGALQKPSFSGAPAAPEPLNNPAFPTIPTQPGYSIPPAYPGGDFGKLTENVATLLNRKKAGGGTAAPRDPSIVYSGVDSEPYRLSDAPYQDWPVYQGQGDPF